MIAIVSVLILPSSTTFQPRHQAFQEFRIAAEKEEVRHIPTCLRNSGVVGSSVSSTMSRLKFLLENHSLHTFVMCLG